jgi:hypothetical protein
MKKLSTELALTISKADKNTIQLILLVITLGMLVIGAGAPISIGGPGG